MSPAKKKRTPPKPDVEDVEDDVEEAEPIPFVVTGPRSVAGVAPGKKGESDDPEWVAQMERAGHIDRLDDRSEVFPTGRGDDDADAGADAGKEA